MELPRKAVEGACKPGRGGGGENLEECSEQEKQGRKLHIFRHLLSRRFQLDPLDRHGGSKQLGLAALLRATLAASRVKADAAGRLSSASPPAAVTLCLSGSAGCHLPPPHVRASPSPPPVPPRLPAPALRSCLAAPSCSLHSSSQLRQLLK
eukprot:756697-Hanusia_phi.AAC.3